MLWNKKRDTRKDKQKETHIKRGSPSDGNSLSSCVVSLPVYSALLFGMLVLPLYF